MRQSQGVLRAYQTNDRLGKKMLSWLCVGESHGAKVQERAILSFDRSFDLSASDIILLIMQ